MLIYFRYSELNKFYLSLTFLIGLLENLKVHVYQGGEQTMQYTDDVL